MTRYVIAYLATAGVFFALDFLWLGVLMKSFYNDRLAHLMAEQVSVAPAALFYLAYVAGIVIFCVAPALESGSWRTALVFGALFGFFAYGTYDMTNLATLRGWPLSVSLVDLAWGTALTAASAVAGTLVTRAVWGA
jgi:uncharacterized membrane protein